jgi:hypothetical protein
VSTHKVPTVTRNPFHKERSALNGRVPPATEFRRRANSFNHVLGYAKKMWTTRGMALGAVDTPGASEIAIWNSSIHTGEGTDTLWAYVGLVKTDGTIIFGIPPTFKIEVYPAGGGALVSSVAYVFNQTAATAAITPDDINHTLLKITGLSPNTAYTVLPTRISGARCVYMMLVEGRATTVSTSTSGVCDPSTCRADGDIDDASIAKLVTANNSLWRHSQSPLLCWAADAEIASSGGSSGAPTITGNTSYTDIYTNRAFTLDTRYRTTLMRTTVPVKIDITSARISGTGTLDVRLTDGTNHLAITGMGDGGAYGHTTRYSATGTLPAALTTGWHLEARQSNALTEHELYSVVVYPYET